MLCDEGWGGPALGEVLGRSGSIARDAKAPRDRAACGVSAHACNDPCRAPAAALTPTRMPGVFAASGALVLRRACRSSARFGTLCDTCQPVGAGNHTGARLIA